MSDFHPTHRAGPLGDRFGRVHRSLRISVTDRCNIRCFYCMPPEPLAFLPRNEILTYEEIARVVRVATRLGIHKFRITGGEPLVRAELWKLIHNLVGIEGVDEVALTTNGMLLAEQAMQLREAGLGRINISLDTLREEVFESISRRKGLDRVLEGIAAAQEAGFTKIRLNALSIRDLTEDDIVPLAAYAFDRGLELRFIEFMPLDAEQQWESAQVLSGSAVRTVIEEAYGPLVPVVREDASQPAVDYAFADRPGRVGFINPVSAPFCGNCDRLRLTAEGQIRNCLFSTHEWDVRPLLRDGEVDDNEIAAQFFSAVAEKKAGHGINSPEFLRPERAMYQIGG
ncbi:MAG: GTP 3',8-cyclase MoaA [Pirellulales bacterium]|nr:GTP 3',8-cyclase MoaA [Pirellulales bacterium]